jgi:hypothetical protein
MTLQADFSSLENDANLWDHASETLGSARRSAAGLMVPDTAFSFRGGDTSAAYEAARGVVEKYLRQGRRETASCAVALTTVRKTFEGTDEDAKSSLHGTWNPH